MSAGSPTVPEARVRWTAPPPVDQRVAERIQTETGLARPISELLARRGWEFGPELRAFLRPRLEATHPAESLPDMSRALARLLAAREGGETVLVHGDYDVDGMSATALLVAAGREAGIHARGFVPHRRDGYDLGPAGLARADEIGATLIVTADCGVRAHEAVKAAASRKIDVIVTDHHRPGPTLPPAIAVINPQRDDSTYPFRGLAGVGVAFKLAAGLFARLHLPPERLYQHLDLVALGTIADQMPLTDENRVLARLGLRALERSRKPGVRALLWEARRGGSRQLRAEDVAFALAPRLNSSGRIGAAEDGLRLLMCDEPAAADELARHVDRQNAIRRAADRDLFDQALALVAELDLDATPVPVLHGDEWHPGVLGIAASRLVDRLGRPVVLVGFDGDRGRGSARSVEGFHLFRALAACGDLLERFGGHAMAAGFDIRRDRLGQFREALQEYAAGHVDPARVGRDRPVDLVLPLEDLTADLAAGLDYLEPFGADHPTPIVRTDGVRLERLERVGGGAEHLRGTLASENVTVRFIGFGMGDRELTDGDQVDVVYEVEPPRAPGGVPGVRLLDLIPRVGG